MTTCLFYNERSGPSDKRTERSERQTNRTVKWTERSWPKNKNRPHLLDSAWRAFWSGRIFTKPKQPVSAPIAPIYNIFYTWRSLTVSFGHRSNAVNSLRKIYFRNYRNTKPALPQPSPLTTKAMVDGHHVTMKSLNFKYYFLDFSSFVRFYLKICLRIRVKQLFAFVVCVVLRII